MKVRCWVILGSARPDQAMLLPPEPPMHYSGSVPNAADFMPGQWIMWAPSVGMNAVALICVELPLP